METFTQIEFQPSNFGRAFSGSNSSPLTVVAAAGESAAEIAAGSTTNPSVITHLDKGDAPEFSEDTENSLSSN
jgi:hypothetical protein